MLFPGGDVNPNTFPYISSINVHTFHFWESVLSISNIEVYLVNCVFTEHYLV